MDLEWEEIIIFFMHGHSGRYLRSHKDLNNCFSQFLSFLIQGIMEHLIFASSMKGRRRRSPDLCPLANKGYCKKARIRIREAVGSGDTSLNGVYLVTCVSLPIQRPRVIASAIAGAVSLPTTWPLYTFCYHDLKTSWNRDTILEHSVYYKFEWQ